MQITTGVRAVLAAQRVLEKLGLVREGVRADGEIVYGSSQS